jgi:nitroreductase
MDVFRCIVERRSVRSYTEKDIPEESLQRILEAARWAQSAVNRQPWEFITIHDKDMLREISKHARYGGFIKDAPVAIAVVTNPKTKWHLIDGSTAVQNMALAAWEMGIGTCWIGSLEREEVKKLLGIPDELHLLTVLPFGYPATVGSSTRRDLDSMIHRDRW